MKKRLSRAAIIVAAAAALFLGAAHAADETIETLTRKLWAPERVESAIRAVNQQKKDGLLSDAGYAKRKAMLEGRLAGTFKPAALSVENPPLNFIQNGGFEQINRNSAPIAAAGCGGTVGVGAATM